MINYLQLVLGFALIAGLVYVILVWLLPPVLGAPYVPTKRERLEAMLALAQGRPGERVVDLGSGDGRIVIAFARAGLEAHGYEINPWLVLWSRLDIRRRGLQKLAHIHWASFRSVDFSKFNIVAVYGLVGIMKSLESRLRLELPSGARVVSNTFSFPRWPMTARRGNVYLYTKT